MQLIKTSKELWIGDIDTYIDDDGVIQHIVSKAKEHYQIQLLVDSNFQPIFEANACILDSLILNRAKDTSQLSKALLNFFRYIKSNSLDWKKTKIIELEQPIRMYRSKLIELKDKGIYSDTTAAGYLSAIRKFYKFAFKHRYINHLPYNISGKTKYGDDITDCTIRIRRKKRELRPLSERHLTYLYKSWHVVPIEIQLGILMSQFVGLRECEVASIRRKHFIIPKDFEGSTVTSIPIGPSTNVNTKGMIDREISIPVWLIKLIQKYHNSPRYQRRQSEFYQMYDSENFPALLNSDGDFYTTKILGSFWSDITKVVRKLDPFYNHKWHDNRATFGCAKMEAYLESTNCNVTQALTLVQKEMGHANPETTQIYLKYWQNNPEDYVVAEVMGRFVDVIITNIKSTA